MRTVQPQPSILPWPGTGALLGDTGVPPCSLEEVRGSAPLAGAPAGSQWRAGDRHQFEASSSEKPDCSVRGRQCERAGSNSLKALFRAQSGGLRSKELAWDYGNHLHFLASLQTQGSRPGARRRGMSLLLRMDLGVSLALALTMSLASLNHANNLQPLFSAVCYPQSPILTLTRTEH